MPFATMIFSAALAAVAMAMPTNDNGKGCSANGTEHEASPISPPTYGTTTSVKVKPTLTSSPPKYSTTTSVKVKPTLPTSYKNEASSTRTSKGPLPTKTPGNGGNDCAKGCITEKQAEQGAEIFRQLIQNYTDTLALTVLTPDFEDYSSSVNIIRNRGNKGPIQVNGISFISREDFMNAQGAQPQIPFDTLNVFHGCDSITVRWQTTDSAAGKATKANDIPAPGIGILNTVPATDNEYGFRIKTLYSEFNAAAWLVNLGVFTPTPVAPTKRDLPHMGAM